MANGSILRPIPLGTIVAESTAAGTDPSYLNNEYIGMTWASVSTTTSYITLDLGAAQTVDTIAFLACSASSNTTIRIRAATSMANTTAAPAYDSGAVAMFNGNPLSSGLGNSYNQITSSTYQFWRIDFGSLSGIPFSSGRLVIGQRFTPAIGFNFGGGRGILDLSILEFAPEGATFKRVGKKLRTLTLTFPIVRNIEIETQLRPIMEQIGFSEYVLVTAKNLGDTYFQPGMYYGPLTADMAITWAVPDGYAAKITMKSVI